MDTWVKENTMSEKKKLELNRAHLLIAEAILGDEILNYLDNVSDLAKLNTWREGHGYSPEGSTFSLTPAEGSQCEGCVLEVFWRQSPDKTDPTCWHCEPCLAIRTTASSRTAARTILLYHTLSKVAGLVRKIEDRLSEHDIFTKED